ncbi:MAG: MazG nucleotide pyrophosphohydrolase domain-containing protein [Alphaproteobacteria bacterium]
MDKLISVEKLARQFGFDWPNSKAILDQILSEYMEVKEDIDNNSDIAKIQEEIGDLIHTAISLCIFMKLDVNDTITRTHHKFRSRIESLIELANHRGLATLHGQSEDLMLDLWRDVKHKESFIKS